MTANTEQGHLTEAKVARALVAKIAAGDRLAETELVERYSRGLAFCLLRLTQDPALREDLQQETLHLTLVKLRNGELTKPESLGSFIAAMGRNLFLDHVRKKKRHGEVALSPQDTDMPADTSNPGQALLTNERAQMVRRVIGDLKHERDRHILYLYYVNQQDGESICRQLGIEKSIFKQCLHRARQRFKQLWQRSLGN